MLWPHNKTPLVFDKHQEDASARFANRNPEISCDLLLPPPIKRPVYSCYMKCKKTHLQSTKWLKLCALPNNYSSIEKLKELCLPVLAWSRSDSLGLDGPSRDMLDDL